MTTFSPNYNTITVSILESKSDSMRDWHEPNCQSKPRPLNLAGMLPISGGLVGSYRIITGTLDVVTSLFKLITGNAWFMQGVIGTQNIIRGTIEIIPTALLIYGAVTGALEVGLLFCFVTTIVVCLLLTFRDYLSSSNPTPVGCSVAAFFDGSCAIKLNPRQSFCTFTYEGWLEQLYQYGTWTRHDFV